MATLNNNELTHYGVLGMKRGVRRYQNKDGTLTPKGKERHEKDILREKTMNKILKKTRRGCRFK